MGMVVCCTQWARVKASFCLVLSSCAVHSPKPVSGGFLQSILWLCQGHSSLPSVRFRVNPFVEEARRRGVEVDVAVYPASAFKRLIFYFDLLSKSKKYDVCVVQKRLVGSFEVALLRKSARVVAYDYDDAVWTNQQEALPPGQGFRSRRLNSTVASVDVIIAGNEYLASAVQGHTCVVIVPTPIDTNVYVPCAEHDEHHSLCVGWMGTSGYLSGIKDAVRLIHASTQKKILVVSNKMPDQDVLECVDYVEWSGDRELEYIQRMDIGVMPIDDDPYTRGKCGFKILQYMSCGVVPIASDVGFNREIIKHGVNGFLVSRNDEWPLYVKRLSDSRSLLMEMSQRARQDVVERFDLRIAATRYLDALNSR